jgi:hypothetical protein
LQRLQKAMSGTEPQVLPDAKGVAACDWTRSNPAPSTRCENLDF